MTITEARVLAAMRKGKALAAQVERLAYGLYLVPSQTEPGVQWTVVEHEGLLRCSCPAALHGKPCAHAAAVATRRREHAQTQAERRAQVARRPPAA